MGVPKFFRWLSERYPKILQRQTFLPNPETHERYFPGKALDDPLISPDPLSTCGLPPEIDRLYIDCNGIIHGCSHNNGKSTGVSEEVIFANVVYYLDRVISDIVRPTELVYLAIDGVAPRAKLNQQRARRYRGGTEELELSVYDAYTDRKSDGSDPQSLDDNNNNNITNGMLESFFEKRKSGKVEATDDDNISKEGNEDEFHPSCITPGTEFFAKCIDYLEYWVQYKISTDPKWKNLKVYFSGPNVPGEGEHKIMEFMRQERARPDYNPNLRHAIMGQDADLILLSLITHEPNLCILREKIIFGQKQRSILTSMGLEVYTQNCHFEWLHMSVLRDYLMFEFETAPAIPKSSFNLENTIDDFVFLTFIVGNDFLPHMPAIDIGDGAFDLIFVIYKKHRKMWRYGSKNPYLTDSGKIVCGKRLEAFLRDLGAHESTYYQGKRQLATADRERMQNKAPKSNFTEFLPSQDAIELKEESDRAKYREMMQSQKFSDESVRKIKPVLSDSALPLTTRFQPEEEELDEGIFSRLSGLLKDSLSDNDVKNEERKDSSHAVANIDDQDLKGRYYYDKFQLTPFDVESHRALRKSYVQGLIWNLKYYFEGCPSWDWYYPYHYGPMLTDVVGIQQYLKEIRFGEKNRGKPLKPFEQLMGCLPPSSANLLPEPYRPLMTDADSPLSKFYPRSFLIDMNGKRFPWEATVLLPFLDANALVEVANSRVTPDMLSEEELARNQNKEARIYYHDPNESSVLPPLTFLSEDYFKSFTNTAKSEVLNLPRTKAKFEPKLLNGVITPSPGFPTLTAAPIRSLWRRMVGVNVHGTRSRYKTAILDMSTNLPAMPPIEVFAKTFIGTTIFINYPYLTEAFVTAFSNQNVTIRGHEAPRFHTANEMDVWQHTMSKLIGAMERGEKLTGTGGWLVPICPLSITVRPLKEIIELPDGSKAKTYASFEITLPFTAAAWSPSMTDPRTENVMLALEKDPFFIQESNHGVVSQDVKSDFSKTYGRDGSRTKELNIETFNSSSHITENSGVPQLPTIRSMTTSTFQRHLKSNTKLQQQRRPYATSSLRPRTVAKMHHGSFKPRAMSLGLSLLVFFGGAVQWGHAGSFDFSSGINQQSIIPNFDGMSSRVTPPLLFEHGTTTLSFVFQDGIIVAVDSRASLGNFVGSKTVEKVLPINSHMLGTMAGGAADCSFWIRKLKGEAELFELSRGYRMSVSRASRLLSNVLYDARDADLSIGTMIMGYDPELGPKIFYVDNTGAKIEGDMFSVGSGSTFALGILDTEQRRHEMNREEAVALGIRAIRHATFRDAFSGGFINVYVITREGWSKIFSGDVASLRRDDSLKAANDSSKEPSAKD
jgi:5'-3' exonuclease/20S proteasome alpha/beta subunit